MTALLLCWLLRLLSARLLNARLRSRLLSENLRITK